MRVWTKIIHSRWREQGAPKRVKKQIHLTLPTSPAHVTTTETFTTFLINHGLTKALRKAFEKRGWSTDQVREFITNFQQKHGKKVPLPKLYGDEDSSDSEGLELVDGSRVGKKAADGAGGSGGNKANKKSAAGGSSSGAGGSGGGSGARAGGSSGTSTSGSGGVGGSGGRKWGQDDVGDGDDPNKRRKMGDEGGPPRLSVAHKEPCKVGTAYPPVNRKLPTLYISRRKERTMLGHHMLDWTPAQKRTIHEARMQGRLVNPTDIERGQRPLRTFIISRRPQHFSSVGCPSRGW